MSGRTPKASWDGRDRKFVGVVLLGLVALHYPPLLVTLGLPIVVIITAVAVFNPYAARLLIADSQLAPDPPRAPFKFAQLFVVFWLITLPINGCIRGCLHCGLHSAILVGFWHGGL